MAFVRFRASPAAGAAAIYTVTSRTAVDDAPLNDPLTHRSRIKFHSDWNYIAQEDVHTGSLALPSRATGFVGATQNTLFAHGKAGVPGVFGVALNLNGSGVDVPLFGTVVIDKDTTGAARMLNLLADSTNVYLSDWGMVAQATGYAGFTLNWVVYVTDQILT